MSQICDVVLFDANSLVEHKINKIKKKFYFHNIPKMDRKEKWAACRIRVCHFRKMSFKKNKNNYFEWEIIGIVHLFQLISSKFIYDDFGIIVRIYAFTASHKKMTFHESLAKMLHPHIWTFFLPLFLFTFSLCFERKTTNKMKILKKLRKWWLFSTKS